MVNVVISAGISCEEALTRQSLIASAIGNVLQLDNVLYTILLLHHNFTTGLQNLTNVRGGMLQPPLSNLTSEVSSELGVTLLFRAMLIYLAEGENQYFHHDFV